MNHRFSFALVTVLCTLGVTQAQAYSAKEAARCAAYNMARSDLLSQTDPTQAARSKGAAIAFSATAIRMGFAKGHLTPYMRQEQDLWHAQLLSYSQTQHPVSAQQLQAISQLCDVIRQDAPEFQAKR